MSDDGGPWAHMRGEPKPAAPPPKGPRPRGRIAWPVVVIALGLAALIFALWKAFPEARLNGQGWGDSLYYAGFALLVGAGIWRAGRMAPSQMLRYGAIWVAIAAGLALGYSYRDDIIAIPQRVAIAFGTGRPVAVGAHELVISQDAEGAFQVVGKVNGQPVRFMIDTGASETVLAPEDARRLGIDLSSLKFDRQSETANGLGYGAAYVADSLEIGPIRMANFKVEINKAPMSSSLLGLSFLSRLDSTEVRGRKLYLKWAEPRR
jgi:aspartyl protease family protein